MNESDVIDDRVVLESGNTQYVACIIPDFDPGNPLKEWDQSVSFFVPSWGGNPSGQAKWVSDQLNDPGLPLTLNQCNRVSEYLKDRTIHASWYEDAPASDFLKLFRSADPSGLYFIVQWNDSGYGDTLKFLPDDDESTRDYAIAYRTAEEVRKDFGVKRITAKVRAQAEANIRADIKTQNAYLAGEVYGWYLLRQELDDDGETIESEEVSSCYSYYGSDEWEYMYQCAKESAESDAANREKEEAEREERDHWRTVQGYLAMDEFDAASYHELSMDDVVGAYEARLSAAFDNLGRVTRQLEEEGYRPHALFG